MKTPLNRFKNNKIYRAAEAFFLGNASYTQLNLMAAAGKKQNAAMPSDILKHQATMMSAQTLESWKTAVMLATDPDNPDKQNLHLLYENQKTDNHLESTIETRIAKTQQSPFKLVAKTSKERDEEAEKLFKTLWFQDFIKLVIEYKFDGTKLIEAFKTNEEGFLTEVTEIKQPFFNPKKGIILKEPGQTTGEDYKFGPLSNYYIQVGKDYKDLGIRTLIAPIILAKKLGLGSWLDFIEKYGVPPLFVTTEREDDERLLELFEMATNFKSNNFMIGRGSEKFEIPNISSTNSQEAFDGLIKRADNETSKRILGGTGLTDEKGFVGSVEIQFELAQFRFTSDKLLVRNIVNEKLIPLLAKLSPVYSSLLNFDFEWDDEDEMTVDKLIKIVAGLGNYFDFDPEQIEQITGLKVLGIKDAGSGTPTGKPEPVASKKSSNINAFLQTRSALRDIEASYTANDCDCDECSTFKINAVLAISMEPYTKLIEKIANDLHEGKMKPSDLNVDMVKQMYKDLSTATETVYGDKWVKFDIKEPQSLVQKFKKNLWQFSCAKTLAELQEMNNLLLDKGRIRPFPEYLQQVRKTNMKFNENYLQAEHQTAVKGCQAAEQWKGFLKDADLFPNLEYRTVGDNLVRPQHALLNGTVKPISDVFWTLYYTPNGWRCRCYVVQTAAKATPGKIDDPSVSPEFRGNVALDEEIFTSKGGFFKLLNMDHKAKVNSEYMKLNAPYDEAYKSKNGKKVHANIFADESDKIANIETAMIIVEKLEKDVFVRPHIEVQNHKNPEYLIDGKLADRKEQKGKNISSNLNSAKKQGCKTVVFDISADYPYSLEHFKNQLKGHILAHYKDAFDEVIIVTGKTAVSIKVKDLLK